MPFRAEVEFYEPATRDDLLRTHIADCYNYIHSSDEQDDDASHALEARYTAAFEIFRALFCNRAEFQRQSTFDDEAVREFMKTATSPNDQVIFIKLSHWTRELLTDYANEECKTTRDATTAAELSGKLELFVKTVGGDGEYTVKPSLWPLVRVIRC